MLQKTGNGGHKFLASEKLMAAMVPNLERNDKKVQKEDNRQNTNPLRGSKDRHLSSTKIITQISKERI